MQIYNSLTRKKEEFIPIEKNKIGMYVCGMTVYDYCHLGHARVLINFDMVYRYFKSKNFEINYIRNITDIDDKIINRANENNEDFSELTNRFITALHEDCESLNILPPTKEPLATQNIQPIIDLINKLIEKNYAYVASNGDVYYSVEKFKHYGQLAHKDLEGLQAGIRVDTVEEKHGELDFVLWKLAKPEEPSWDSPWGKGRPGWHIECSAMSMDCLGNHFDIHGGGFDLQFPHHENEIAQSEAATGEKFVNTWMHVGFVQVNKEKMSKSLGNFFTIRDILKEYPPEVVRYFMLVSHYRSQVNYSDEMLNQAQASLGRLYNSLRDITITPDNINQNYLEKFNQAMDDDFNTPEAMSVLFEISHELNKAKDKNPDKINPLAFSLKSLGEILGILQNNPNNFLQDSSNIDKTKIESLIQNRNKAREEKNWSLADKIRDELADMGVVLEDKDGKTTWRVGG